VQFEHALAPAALNVPAPHWPEHDADGSASDAPKRPAGQSLHVVSPAKLYLPKGQRASSGADELDRAGHA
jgi:hypothetical protein